MHTPPVKPSELGSSEVASDWGVRTGIQQGRLSRNKVSVGEPADGSPPIPGGPLGPPDQPNVAKQGSPEGFPRFLGSLPCIKRSIERHFFSSCIHSVVNVSDLSSLHFSFLLSLIYLKVSPVLMNISVINCSTRRNGFSSLATSMLAGLLGFTGTPLFLLDSSVDDIQSSIDSSDLAIFGCPYLSTGIPPSFFDLLDNLSLSRGIPCIFVLACGNAGILCRGAVHSAEKRLKALGFTHFESVMIDNTYGLALGELLPKHERRIYKAFRSIQRFL